MNVPRSSPPFAILTLFGTGVRYAVRSVVAYFGAAVDIGAM